MHTGGMWRRGGKPVPRSNPRARLACSGQHVDSYSNSTPVQFSSCKRCRESRRKPTDAPPASGIPAMDPLWRSASSLFPGEFLCFTPLARCQPRRVHRAMGQNVRTCGTEREPTSRSARPGKPGGGLDSSTGQHRKERRFNKEGYRYRQTKPGPPPNTYK